MGILIRPLDFNELTSRQNLKTTRHIVPCMPLQCAKAIVVFSSNGDEARNFIRILRNVVRRETFLDMASIDDTFCGFTSRFIVCFVGESR